jgi:stage II sporulation protein Q
MYQKKLKPFVLPLIYSVVIITLLTSVLFLRRAVETTVFEEKGRDFIYVIKNIFGNHVPVVGSEKVIIRPYTDTNVKIVKHFYDYQADAEKQEKSLVYYGNTYIQNSGVDYSGPENFEVISILDGSVINVADDDLLGKIVEIRHSNDLISVYQSLSEVTVKKGDNVSQSQVIGKSGTSNIAVDLKDHLHFEILYKGKVVDPETLYDKTIKDL